MSPSPVQWQVILPVKQLSQAKTRLPLPEAVRAELVLAMAQDTIEAVRASPLVAKVWVVTPDPLVIDRLATDDVGVLPETVDGGSRGGDLNVALMDAASTLRTKAPVPALAVFVADLPSLRGFEVTSVLEQARDHDCCYVADTKATGTTVLMVSNSAEFKPQFGPDSGAHHAVTGLTEIHAERGIQQDVDTLDDLTAARGLGVGRHTADVIARRLGS